MLIQFSVSNWRSVKENQTLSLVLAKGTELIASNSFTPTAPATPSLLRSAAIYGANAAGKSNLLRAMQTMKKMVMDSSKGQRGDLVPVTSFLLDSATEESPSEFEVFFGCRWCSLPVWILGYARAYSRGMAFCLS